MPDTAKVIQLEPDVQRHVRSRLVRLPAAAHALHERGKTLLAARLEAYFDAADDALFDLADKASSNHEQNVFFDSMREVRVQRKSIEKRFVDGFDEAFARLVAVDERDSLVPEGELSPEALSLVQNEDLEQLVAVESTVNRANRDLAMALGRLTSGLRHLVPQPVNEHNNPVGPEVLCTVFMAQVKRLDVDIKAKLVLFKLFDRVLVNELPSIYKNLELLLAEHGIDVHNLRKPSAALKSSAVAPARAQPITPRRVAGSASGAASGPKAVPSVAEPGGAIGPGGASAPEQELMTLLSFVQKLPAATFGGQEGGLDRVLQRVQVHKGQSLDLTLVQQETVRLVSMLFDYMLRERSLAKPIKQMLLRMQVPVLKVALLDVSFFADKDHIARRLLNEIANQAVGWQRNPNDPSSDPFAQCIAQLVERIVRDFDQDVDVFNQAYADLSSFTEKERRRSAVIEKRMVDAEDGKARAEQARNTVALEVNARVGGHRLPRAVNEFARGPFSNVLFVIGLKHGFDSPLWTASVALLSDLIWSVQTKVSAQERQALIIKGPKILHSLRASLDEVSYNPFEVSELLTAIEEIQIARIRGEPIADLVPALNTGPELKPVGVALEAKAAAPKSTGADATALSEDDPYMVSVASFVQGAWFDFSEREGGELLRCRLAAFIRPTGHYIFVNRAGMKVVEKTRRELALLLKTGCLRPVDSGMLFDRALENIVTGLRNSKPQSPLDDLTKKTDT